MPKALFPSRGRGKRGPSQGCHPRRPRGVRSAHRERQARIRALSIITIAVAFLLLASYFYQVVTPFTTGTTVVTVNLLDPTLLALEAVLIVVTFAWLYVGVVNYLFASRLGRRVKEARAKETEIERRLGAPPQ